jgi:hypothetical protein
MGAVWANILHNVYAGLVTGLGWSPTALTNPTTAEGNVVWLHLLFDALLLQPCNPSCEIFLLTRLSQVGTLTRDGQSFKPGTRGFRRTQTDMAALTRASCG